MVYDNLVGSNIYGKTSIYRENKRGIFQIKIENTVFILCFNNLPPCDLVVLEVLIWIYNIKNK